jgi:hypothetical protein
MWAGGKGDGRAIGDSGKTSLMCDAAPSFTISMCWPVPNRFKLTSRVLRDFLTGVLVLLR